MKFPIVFTFAMSTLPLLGAQRNADCGPTSPASCNPNDCSRTYCLGPENYGANAPVRPYTCNGDLELTLAGFYWNAHQDGMEYAIKTHSTGSNEERSTLIDAEYKSPHFGWDFGFKVGLGYNTTCDGWDFGVQWTWYRGKASSHEEAEPSDNTTLLLLWSDFEEADPGDVLFATDIQSNWQLKLNLVDIALGRMYWNSRQLNLRPHVGLRIASIDQNFHLDQSGGSFNDTPSGNDVNNEVDIDNLFKGAGARMGLDSLWNVGCGWSIYGDFAFSLLSGRFSVDHDESNREVATPFSKSKVMEIKDTFRSNVLVADLGIGIHYQTLLCDCDYALAVAFGWEQHLFLNQNQMWRIVLQEGSADIDKNNIYHQRRGDLSTNGWTLRVTFDF
ncbi:MAG: Lpg1974 family pore-forming outer membrane protein [Simkaniaceae bacterium]|nr:Lpg1974 family pore-forming outer membrane protein [Candidatus Sacchlamyda saccharinae]